jgi:hypothetical protein
MGGLFTELKMQLVTLSLLSTQFIMTTVYSHELQENRAALVLRNDRLITVTFYLNLSEVLHKTLMPMGDPIELTTRLAVMSDAEFAGQFNVVKKKIQSGVVFKSVPGKHLKLGNWQWPESVAAQKHLRESTMRAVVSPGHHIHEPPIEVRAQIQSDEPLLSLRVDMPESLRPITLIATRPRQSRLNTSTSSLVINF